MLVPSPDSLQIFTLTAVNGLVDRWRRTDPFSFDDSNSSLSA